MCMHDYWHGGDKALYSQCLEPFPAYDWRIQPGTSRSDLYPHVKAKPSEPEPSVHSMHSAGCDAMSQDTQVGPIEPVFPQPAHFQDHTAVQLKALQLLEWVSATADAENFAAFAKSVATIVAGHPAGLRNGWCNNPPLVCFN